MEKTVRAVLPMLVYAAMQQLVLTTLELLLTMGLQRAGAGELAFYLSHEGGIAAFLEALSVAAAFAVVLRTVRREEITLRVSAGELRGRRMELLAGTVGLLSLSVFLNAFLAKSGMVTADPSAAAARAQAERVPVFLGILVYGVLSPLVEETVFRGVTLHRLFLLGRERWEEKKAFLVAAVMSALLFGVFHGNAVQGVYAAVMGFGFCLFLALTKSLSAVVVLHGGINVLTLLVSQNGSGFAGMSTGAMAAAGGTAACCGICLFFLRKKELKKEP